MPEQSSGPKYRRWDWAWKEFLNPEEVWCKWFIKHLLDESFLDYDIEFGELEALGEEQHTRNGIVQVVDRVIQVIVDKKRHVLHFEFQSTYDKQMAMRMLQYGLQRAQLLRATRGEESYELPTAVIVYVREIPGVSGDSRTIELNVNRNTARITYPVIYGWKKVPHIHEIMNASNDEELGQAIVALCKEQDSMAEMALEKLSQACVLISNQNAFSSAEGVDERSLKMKSKVVLSGKTLGEVWDERERVAREEGIKEGRRQAGVEAIQGLINNLVSQFGMTEAEAADYLKGAGFPPRLSHLQKGSINPLNLGEGE